MGRKMYKQQAASGLTSNNENVRCLPTSFFRAQKSTTAVGSSSENEEASAYFFADKDTDEDSPEEEAAKLKAAEVEKAAEARKAAEEEKAAQERSTEKARLDKIAQQAKIEEEVRIADEKRENMIREWTDKTVESVEKVIKPLTEIQDGVPAERIKGAAIAATALTFLASKGVVASGAIGLGAAYLSISKTIAGDFLRTVGGVTWDATETASKLADQFGVLPTFGDVDKTVLNKYKGSKPPAVKSDVDEGELAFIEAEDDDLARVLREAESVIGEADAAIAKAEADQKEKVKQSIEEELKQITSTTEVEEETEIAEVAEEEEEEELEAEEEIDEDEVDEEDEEELEAEEEEEEIDEDEVDEEEAEDLEAEEEKEEIDEDEVDEEEEELEAEEEVDDEDDDTLFDDDQFMAAVELAQEGIEGKIVGVDDIITDTSEKAEWDAAGELANELRQDTEASSEGDVEDEEDDFFEDVDLNFEDIDLEALGKAAREAVESFESEQQEVGEAILDEKQQWADSMVEEDDDEDDELDFEEEVASEEPVSRDWSSLKVVELRQELKERGLKTTGKKADLVSLLEVSDLDDSMESDDGGGDDEDDDDDNDNEDEIVDFEDFDIEELGRQARAAVEMFQTNVDGFDEEPTEEMLAELESEMAINGEFLEDPKPSLDLSKMTVVQLKDECRNRGLKVGGKKAELIERLENAAK
eukprot:CAMPEP_0197283624 /NCGR_PEP_ID=MMETSP1432-20130617/25026_1 /TAXON_ID=44447 /ORGANISM="Pseudo-nitzschia delicatissima, Strain UNC1205" /LENGTH=700 /DNA_ID=CAMNT_0042750617 /DNA_START=107 /DNA_END=2210 /DNA_ORIENTATION=-